MTADEKKYLTNRQATAPPTAMPHIFSNFPQTESLITLILYNGFSTIEHSLGPRPVSPHVDNCGGDNGRYSDFNSFLQFHNDLFYFLFCGYSYRFR